MNRSLQMVVKHMLDCMGAVLLILCLAPIMAVIAAAIVIESGRPALFIQTRVGRQGRLFQLYKFRTMISGAARKGLGTTVAVNDDRITRVGAFLRSWSLDELPQILNVVKGDMSLVGPRPTLEYQVAQYTPFQRRRLEMKQGITGWAQVNGRNALPWAKRIDLDVWYVDHFSLLLDARILFRTIGVFWRREGLYGPGGVNDDFVKKSASPWPLRQGSGQASSSRGDGKD